MSDKKFVFKGNKVSALFDMLATKKQPQKMLDLIDSSSTNDVFVDYQVNKVARALHPRQQNLKLVKIVRETNDCKSFYFESEDKNSRTAFFRAGQYLSIGTIVDKDNIIHRPYSISSSPKDALKGFYRITIKSKPDGLISNLMLENAKVGQSFVSSGPEGAFYYDPMRDAEHVIAIAGGSGITPFISMAKAILEKSEDFKLTIIYGCKTEKEILFKKELDEISKKTDKVKVVYVLSNDKNNKNKEFIHGYINLSLIKKYMTKETSIHICGSKALKKYILKEIQPLKLEQKYIRTEAHNDLGNPKFFDGYKNTGNKLSYKIKVKRFNEFFEINARADETIIVSLQRSGISTQSKCLAGECSWCRIRLIKGKVFVPSEHDFRRKADKYNSIYFSCSSFPVSDLEIETY